MRPGRLSLIAPPLNTLSPLVVLSVGHDRKRGHGRASGPYRPDRPILIMCIFPVGVGARGSAPCRRGGCALEAMVLLARRGTADGSGLIDRLRLGRFQGASRVDTGAGSVVIRRPRRTSLHRARDQTPARVLRSVIGPAPSRPVIFVIPPPPFSIRRM